MSTPLVIVVVSRPMAFTRQEARSLCTKNELELVAASDGKALGELSLARVQSKLQRARALRDKYRDLERTQRLEARGKPSPRSRAPRAEGAVRTARKAEIFEVVTHRFEARAAELEQEIAQGKRLAKAPASAAKRQAPRAADPPSGQSKKGHRRARRRTIQQAIDAAPVEDNEALDEMQLPKGTRSAQRRLARKPPRKKAAKKKAAKKTTKAATTKKKATKKVAKATATNKKAAKKTTKATATKKKGAKKAAKKKTSASAGAKRRGKAKSKLSPVSPAARNKVKAHSIKQMSHAKAAGRRGQARRDKR